MPAPKVFPYTYIRNTLVKSEKATVSIQCKAIQYGLGCFTGIRGNWNAKHKQIYLFRLDEHYKRLVIATKTLGMSFPYTEAQFQEIILKLIKKNKAKGDIYLRPTVYAGSTLLTPRFNNADDDLAIYMISLKDYFKSGKGLNVCISSYRRFHDSMMSTKAKITGAYCNGALAKSEALQNGYDEAIMLNQSGTVAEASGANIFAVINGEIYTPPIADNILNGITRNAFIQILRKEGYTVREESIDRSTLYAADELFFTGTAAKIAHIATVDKRKIGKGKQGPIVAHLSKVFEKIIRGDHPDYQHYLTNVY